MTENRVSLQKYAMTFGTYMGVFWIIKFIFFPLGFTYPLSNFLFIGLTIAVPFIGYRFVRGFRDRACGGKIGFIQAWLFLIFMYMFAALLTAVAHYIYFRFMDNGFVVQQTSILLDSFPTNILPGMNKSLEQARMGLDIIRSLSAIELTMQLLSQNFMTCCIMSLITAPFVMKKN